MINITDVPDVQTIDVIDIANREIGNNNAGITQEAIAWDDTNNEWEDDPEIAKRLQAVATTRIVIDNLLQG